MMLRFVTLATLLASTLAYGTSYTTTSKKADADHADHDTNIPCPDAAKEATQTSAFQPIKRTVKGKIITTTEWTDDYANAMDETNPLYDSFVVAHTGKVHEKFVKAFEDAKVEGVTFACQITKVYAVDESAREEKSCTPEEHENGNHENHNNAANANAVANANANPRSEASTSKKLVAFDYESRMRIIQADVNVEDALARTKKTAEGLEGAAESEIVNPNSANLMTFNLCLCVICWFFLGTY